MLQRFGSLVFDCPFAVPGAWSLREDGADATETADVRVAIGAVPSDLSGETVRTRLFAAAPGAVLLTVPDVGRFLIRDGRTVAVDPAAGADAADLGVFLAGSVWAALCAQRGWLPLHACTAEIDGGAVAFSADAGVGKSTLAAAFAHRGFRLVSEDVAPVDCGGDRPVVMGSAGRLKLRPDALDHFGLERGSLVRRGMAAPKFSVPLMPPPAARGRAATPLTHLFTLRDAEPGEARGVVRTSGIDVLRQIHGAIYRPRIVLSQRSQAAVLADVVRIADTVRVGVLARRRDLGALDEAVDLTAAAVRDARP